MICIETLVLSKFLYQNSNFDHDLYQTSMFLVYLEGLILYDEYLKSQVVHTSLLRMLAHLLLPIYVKYLYRYIHVIFIFNLYIHFL